jgi:leucyl aminopeptidase
MQAIAALKLPRHVVALLPVTENMPGGDAFKPGDVLTQYDGQTVEIINTDAEGRLILADALAYAVKTLAPQALIDVATLTGACLIALGDVSTGLMTNHQGLADHVLAAAGRVGERTWQLPLFEEYEALLKSDIADMRNSVGRPAGAIGAGCYLQRFVGDVPWVHLDIAGTVWADREMPHLGKGPTGAPVRTLVEVIETWRPV